MRHTKLNKTLKINAKNMYNIIKINNTKNKRQEYAQHAKNKQHTK